MYTVSPFLDFLSGTKQWVFKRYLSTLKTCTEVRCEKNVALDHKMVIAGSLTGFHLPAPWDLQQHHTSVPNKLRRSTEEPMEVRRGNKGEWLAMLVPQRNTESVQCQQVGVVRAYSPFQENKKVNGLESETGLNRLSKAYDLWRLGRANKYLKRLTQ